MTFSQHVTTKRGVHPVVLRWSDFYHLLFSSPALLQDLFGLLVKRHGCKPEEKHLQDPIIVDCTFPPRPFSRCCAGVGIFSGNK